MKFICPKGLHEQGLIPEGIYVVYSDRTLKFLIPHITYPAFSRLGPSNFISSLVIFYTLLHFIIDKFHTLHTSITFFS